MDKKTNCIQNIILLLLVITFIGNQFFIYTFFDYGIKKNLIITVVLFTVYFMIGSYIFFIRRYISKSIGVLFSLPKQLFVITSFILFFLTTAYISPYTNIVFSARVCLMINSTLVFCLGMLLCWFYVIYLKGVQLKLRLLITKKNFFLVIFLGILPALLRVPMLGTLQRWDAGEYYYALGDACQSFSYSLSDFFNNFRLCNHTTLGFSLLMAPGEFLNPRGIVGVLLINLFLTIGSGICLYVLLKKIFTQLSDRYLVGIILIYSITPFFLGSFGYLTPDYIVPITFIFALTAEYKKEYLLQFFWLAIMANTKEFSIIIIFGYFFAKMIYILIKNIYEKKNFLKPLLQNTSLWIGFLSGMFYFLILCLQGGILWKGGNPDSNTVAFSNTGINCFGINFPYIIFRLKQHFILNFSWIFTLLLLVSIILFWVKTVKHDKDDMSGDKEFLISFSGALCFAMVANLVYITAGAYRYCTFFFALYPIFVLLFCYDTLRRYVYPKLRMVITMVIISLLMIESYIHIDPVSRIAFDTASTGSWYTVLTNYEHTKFGNDLCNNYQYTFVDKSFDKMLREIEYDGSQDIIIVANQGQGSQFNGNGDYYKVCWNRKWEKRVIYDDDKLETQPELIPINMVWEETLEENLQNDLLKEKAVVFFVPYYHVDEEAELKNLEKYYLIEKRNETKSVGGSISYYEMNLKDF